MHKTTSGEKRKALRKEALELAMQSRAAMKAAVILPQAGPKAQELQEEADRLRAEAEALKDRARLEDLSLWTMEKSRAARRAAGPTIIGWPPCGRGAVPRMDSDAALQKARAMKVAALGIKI